MVKVRAVVSEMPGYLVPTKQRHWSVVLQLEHASESRGGLLKTRITGPHPQSF